MSLHEMKIRLDVLREDLDIEENILHRPSIYWSNYVEVFDYVFEMRDEVSRKIRHHTDMLTSAHPHMYFNADDALKKNIIDQYISISNKLNNYHFSEPSSAGGFGFNLSWNGKDVLVNIDLIRYMQVFLKLNANNQLSDSYSRIVEIGGGYGGLAAQFKIHYPEATYIIVDLPHTLYFSASYLDTVFPDSSIYIYDKNDRDIDYDQYDFVLLPPWAMSSVGDNSVDLVINQASLGEMTPGQVEYYLGQISRVINGVFLSHNRRHGNPLNEQLIDLTKMIENSFSVLNQSDIVVPTSVKIRAKLKKYLSRYISKRILQVFNITLSDVEPDNYYIWLFCVK